MNLDEIRSSVQTRLQKLGLRVYSLERAGCKVSDSTVRYFLNGGSIRLDLLIALLEFVGLELKIVKTKDYEPPTIPLCFGHFTRSTVSLSGSTIGVGSGFACRNAASI